MEVYAQTYLSYILFGIPVKTYFIYMEAYELAMPEQQHDWTWEPPVCIRRSPEEINNLKERFKCTVDAIGGSKTSVANRMWLKIQELVEQDPSLLDCIGIINNSVAMKYKEALDKRTLIKALQAIREENFDTDEEFIEWCQSEDIDKRTYCKVIKNQKLDDVEPIPPEWKEKIISWMLTGMLADGKAHPTGKIKDAAMNDGIITDAGGWNRIRSIASDMGYTTEQRGWWMKPTA